MAGAKKGWVEGLLEWLGLEQIPPTPGSKEALLEETRLGALLDREARKLPEQRDEELLHTLRVQFYTLMLKNAQAKADGFAHRAATFERPGPGECCAASGWVRQRVAASLRSMHDYYCQFIQQIAEEVAAAEARRPAFLAARPALRLHLPEALQQPPPRLDMCSACARRIEQAELNEHACEVHGEDLQRKALLRGLLAAPAAAAASRGEAGAAAAAADMPQGEAQRAQQAQQQQICGGASDVDGNGGAPATPKQPPLPPPLRQRTSSEQEQEQRQEWDAAYDRHLPLSDALR